jgi:hypothetical protein
MQEPVGLAKGNAQVEKKKGDKMATANSAYKDGIPAKRQVCGSEHSALDIRIPEISKALRPPSIRRGKLLPGEPGNNHRQREDKEESDDELIEKICLMCSKLKLYQVAKTHSTQECRNWPSSTNKR